ncbi:MAG TPA: crosslink repair DNA glycosylase YcaQ family protein [Opitutaceae bacterium]|jgi:hypothetical protein
MSQGIRVDAQHARRFLLRAHFLDRKAPDIGTVVEHHGYVQIDPINVSGRMHDHILRNRVEGYAEEGLMGHVHGGQAPRRPAGRTVFEHHLPGKDILVAFPLSAWPHLLASMRGRSGYASAWSGRLTPREKEFAAVIMERFASGGGLGPEAFDDDRRGRRTWGAATLAKATLQKLFFHGRLLISGRQGNRRLYDLPERVLPPAILAAGEPGARETARWLALTRLRQHRLVALRRSEVDTLGDAACEVRVEGCPLLHCLAEDLPLFDAPPPGAQGEALLLAPLDPMIYDRRVTQALWGFDYCWEVYVPAQKRKRGYYALPVLAGTELVGHVDLKADRARGRLQVVSRRVARGQKTGPAVQRLARFLGLKAR